MLFTHGLRSLALRIQNQNNPRSRRRRHLQRGIFAVPTVESLEDRLLLAATWIEQGPGPHSGLEDVIVGPNNSNSVNGAVEIIAFHPTNRNIAYAGSVNGGIWRTDNYQASHPTWKPLTDSESTLAIGSVAFSPLDTTGKTLFVGTGSFSNGNDGGSAQGILLTTDGGAKWENLATATAFGTNGFIRRILPTGIGRNLADQVVLVAAKGGLYRSKDGGKTFDHPTGVPTSLASDVIADPNNNNRFYAAFPDNGVYVSTDGGLKWNPIHNNAGGMIGGIMDSKNIELAAHDAGNTTVLYVGVVDRDEKASGIFRDVLGGDGVNNNNAGGLDEAAEFSFKAIGAVPDINRGGMGVNDFAIVADPKDPNVVYIGGDGPPHLFRGDAMANTWTSIMRENANGTSPHPDVRSLVFHNDTTLVTTDDGGIYSLNKPDTTNGGSWITKGGDLRAIEQYSIAYDVKDGLLFHGTQDNGCGKQTTTGAQTWKDDHQCGDGGTQAHDRFTNTDYRTSNNFGGLSSYADNGDHSNVELVGRAIAVTAAVPQDKSIVITSVKHGLKTGISVHFSGIDGITEGGFHINGRFPVTFISDDTFSIVTEAVATGEYAGGSTGQVPGLDNLGSSDLANGVLTDLDFFLGKGGFETHPMVTNAVIGNRLMLGRRGLYESANSGDVIVSLTAQLTGKAVDEEITSIAYGSKRAGKNQPEVFYVGTNGDDPAPGIVYVRDENKVIHKRKIARAAGRVQDIAIDPDDWHRAYVLQDGKVYVTVDGGVSWKSITDNLATLSTDLRTIALATNTSTVGDGQIVVGGLGSGSVFSRSTSTTAGANWTKVGQGLPNVLVTDLLYEPTNDTVFIGTFGRGAWSLPNISAVGQGPALLTPSGTIDVVAPANGNGPNIQFSWAAVSDAQSYELWVSGYGSDGNFEQILSTKNIFGTTKSVPLTDLTQGSLRIWVRANLTTGAQSNWSSPQNVTLRATPTVTGPAANVSGHLTADDRPDIQWASADGAKRFKIWLTNLTTGRVQQFNVENPPLQEVRSFRIPTGLQKGQYRVWVQTMDVDDRLSRWSAAYEFHVNPKPQNLSLGVSTLQSGPLLTWDRVNAAAHYEVYVRIDGETSPLIRETVSTDWFRIPNVLPPAKYAFWVRAVFQGHRSRTVNGDWSAPSYFGTLGAPAVTGPVGTGVERTVNVVRPTVKWTPVNGAATYQIQVREGNSDLPLQQTPDNSTSIGLTTDLNEGKHTVWVRALDAKGVSGRWSRPFTFTATGGKPVITSPTNFRRVATFPTIFWSSVNGLTRYQIWIDKPGPAGKTTIRQEVTGTSFFPAARQTSGNYRVWVRAIFANNTFGAWSSAVNFTVAVNNIPTDDRFQLVKFESNVKPTLTLDDRVPVTATDTVTYTGTKSSPSTADAAGTADLPESVATEPRQ